MSGQDKAVALANQIGRLQRDYAPKPTPWTNLPVAEQRAMSEHWVTQLAQFPVATVTRAVDEWQAEDRAWFPALNDLVVRCHGIVRSDARARTPQTGVGNCDGSGWLPDAGTPPAGRPCPRCNPWLHKLFGTPGWARYLSGSPLDYLVPELKLVAGVLRTPDGLMPSPCMLVDDPRVPQFTMPPDQGRRLVVEQRTTKGVACLW